MKKVFLTLALVFATSTVLVSCGGDAEGSDDASATEEPAGDENEEDGSDNVDASDNM